MSLFSPVVAVLAPGGVGLLRSSHEGGPREDGGLFGETGFCLYSIVFRFFSIFEGAHSFPLLLIFLSVFVAEAVSSANPVRTALVESSSFKFLFKALKLI